MASLRRAGRLAYGVAVLFVVGCGNQPARVLQPEQIPHADGAIASSRHDPNQTGYIGPIICFFNEFFDYCYSTPSYCPCPSTEVLREVEAGRIVTMNWNAQPAPGTSIRMYRWSLDIADVSDETPRIDEATDLAHWSTPSLTATSAQLGPWSVGEQHRLYVDVGDDMGARSLGIVRFVVVPATNQPPDCGAATAMPSRLWPPNQRWVPVRITGVIDPDGDPVTIRVSRVTQDEPVQGHDHDDLAVAGDVRSWGGADGEDALWRGDDHERDRGSCPDAIIDPVRGVKLRAERSGRGNGRVYTLWFTASDPGGASCEGSVQVCVPHDLHHSACIDDGQRFDSTGPCEGRGGHRGHDDEPHPGIAMTSRDPRR